MCGAPTSVSRSWSRSHHHHWNCHGVSRRRRRRRRRPSADSSRCNTLACRHVAGRGRAPHGRRSCMSRRTSRDDHGRRRRRPASPCAPHGTPGSAMACSSDHGWRRILAHRSGKEIHARIRDNEESARWQREKPLFSAVALRIGRVRNQLSTSQQCEALLITGGIRC